MRLPPDEKYVKVGAGYTRSRLPLGKKITPDKRDRTKDEPYFYVLKFFPGRRVESLPSFETLSMSKLFGIDGEEYRRLSLMPYEMSKEIRTAYFEDSPNRLEADLQPRLMVYAVASLDDGESVLYIPRNVSGDSIEDVFGKLNKRQGHITFLQKFLAGLGDERFIDSLNPKDRKKVRDAGIKNRVVVVMRTNVGYVQGKFISHARFLDIQNGLKLGKKEDEPEQ